jgi:cytochrome bd-type quinol oxidase subunit 2
MSSRQRSWGVPAALVALSVIPVSAGTLRLIQLAGGPELIPADSRFSSPLPLIIHIVSSAVFALVGAFQFARRFRRRHRTWHRRAGRILVVAGLLVVASALWMTVFYEPEPGTGNLLYGFRLILTTATASCLVLGFTAARRRDLTSHRAWMIRAYALALGAGTQAFTVGIGTAIFGTSDLVGDLSRVAAWVINLTVAELIIRRTIRRPARRRTPAPSTAVQSIT